MLAAEGHVHKRQRRVATPSFSIQNLRALVPLVFSKGNELKEKWLEMLSERPPSPSLETDKLSMEIDGELNKLYLFDYFEVTHQTF